MTIREVIDTVEKSNKELYMSITSKTPAGPLVEWHMLDKDQFLHEMRLPPVMWDLDYYHHFDQELDGDMYICPK